MNGKWETKKKQGCKRKQKSQKQRHHKIGLSQYCQWMLSDMRNWPPCGHHEVWLSAEGCKRNPKRKVRYRWVVKIEENIPIQEA